MQLFKFLPLAFLISSFSFGKNLEREAVKTYCDIAFSAYSDSLTTAKNLKKATDKLFETPTPKNLQLAREAWIKSRVPYQQSEVFRFGNKIVDDWEMMEVAFTMDSLLLITLAHLSSPQTCLNMVKSLVFFPFWTSRRIKIIGLA